VIGKTISHYKIVEELGRGGMGVVYKAQDLTLKRTVALKFLSPHLLADEEQKKRFLHEAQAAAALDHPNISTIYEVHEDDGQTFMAMAHIAGQDLSEKIRSGVMEIPDVLDIVVQVARGLAKAHSEGIVHRDIKPGNIRITPEGQAKVVDFGLAKLATHTRLTKTGTTVGTVAYMSPEQATSGEADHRADIWSLGGVLYEMLSGRLPFRGEVEAALMYSILNEEPEPVTSLRKDVSIALEDIVEKALTKDPAKRYQTMDELLSDLETQRDHITLGITERRFTAFRKLRRRKRQTGTVIAAVVIALAIFFIQKFYSSGIGIDSVAVLPFSNLSGDPEQEYFSDGMTESLINEVGQIGALRVISRTSVMRFKKTEKPLPEIAGELNVDAIVEASVRRTGGRIIITAQLIRAEPEELLWSENYNRDGRDVTILLSEVARAIADRIETAVTPQEQERLTQVRTVDPEAHDEFLRGRYYLYVWTEEAFRNALAHFRSAIDVDPTYALAYAGLAECYVELALFGFMSREEAGPKAKAAAQKALELDPSLGIAQAFLGYTKFTSECDWHGPEEDFRRAVELSPSNPDVRMWYDMYLTATGRHEEAIVHSKRAVELDPLTPSTTLHLAWVYEYAGRYDDVIEVSKAGIEMNPSDPYGQLQLAGGYEKKGMRHETITAIDSALALSANPDDQSMLTFAAYGFALVGRKDEAAEMLNKVLSLSEGQYVAPGNIALVYKGLGETDKMFEWLEKAYEAGCGSMFLKVDYGEFRDDPRYIKLARGAGIPLDG